MKPGPSLGIFWVYGRQLISFAKPINMIPEVAGTADTDLAHADLWDEVVRKHRNLAGQEYWVLPRGRVVLHVRGRWFVIIASSSIVGDQTLVSSIMRRFHLPASHCRLSNDRHYDPPGDDLFEDE